MNGIATLGPSIVRTVTPIIVGAILTLLLAIGIELPENMQTELLAAIGLGVTALVQILYYVVSRFVEEKFPQFGFLLGNPKTPDSYSNVLDTRSLSKPAAEPEPEPTTMYLSEYDAIQAPLAPAPLEEDSTPPPADYKPRHAGPGIPTPADVYAATKEREK